MLNVHPLLVHFPVALLTIYALLELLRFTRITALPYTFYVKATFVIIGTASSYAAYLSGLLIGPQFMQGSLTKLVQMHGFFAMLTAVLYTVIALAYLFAWLKRADALKSPRLQRFGDRADRFVMSGWSVLTALIGLTLVTITGALGGAIAYGPDIDPFVSVIYTILIGR
jgi:uncharacterized membrane protein